MNHPLDIPLIESLDDFGWDPQEVRDLIQTTPLLYDADGLPVGYEAATHAERAASYLHTLQAKDGLSEQLHSWTGL